MMGHQFPKKKVRRNSSKPDKNITLIVVDAHFHVPHMHEKNTTFMMSFIEYCSLEHRVVVHLNMFTSTSSILSLTDYLLTIFIIFFAFSK